MADTTNTAPIEFKPNGREKMRVTAQGVTLHYTYADEDRRIPDGMRLASFLEPDPYHKDHTND